MPNAGGLLILFLVAGALLLVILVALVVHGSRNPPRRTAAYAVAHGLPCDPGDIELPYEAWTLERPGGVGVDRRFADVHIRLAVWDSRIANNGDLTIVFVHGWGQSRIDMLSRVGAWRDAASRLVFYDLRGHGESDGPSRLGHGEDEDLVVLLETLGSERVLLVGCSMGAVISIGAAIDDRVANRVVGVAAYGTYADFSESLVGRLQLARLPARPITDLAMLWFRLRGIRHRSVLEAASALRCPLLVVHGEADRAVPVGDGEALADAAPDAILYRAVGAGHLDAHVVDGVGHDEVVGRFLERVKGG